MFTQSTHLSQYGHRHSLSDISMCSKIKTEKLEGESDEPTLVLLCFPESRQGKKPSPEIRLSYKTRCVYVCLHLLYVACVSASLTCVIITSLLFEAAIILSVLSRLNNNLYAHIL